MRASGGSSPGAKAHRGLSLGGGGTAPNAPAPGAICAGASSTLRIAAECSAEGSGNRRRSLASSAEAAGEAEAFGGGSALQPGASVRCALSSAGLYHRAKSAASEGTAIR
mmetsp:Transcript_28678/g.83816  ORF Transcript_28678/g.83816 Transcript_28678/m.83816 type:complete len:110 (-) Transcript_28678:283-612(-)